MQLNSRTLQRATLLRSITLQRINLAATALAGGQWVTIRGARVYIKDGAVVGGAGGKLNGQRLYKSGMSKTEHLAEANKHLQAAKDAPDAKGFNEHSEIASHHLERAKDAPDTPAAKPEPVTPARAGNGTAPTDDEVSRFVSANAHRDVNGGGRVPIHDIRAHVAATYGPQFSGEHLDKQLKRLHGDKLDLVSANDPSGVPAAHRNAGVKIGGGTENTIWARPRAQNDFSPRAR